MLGGALAYAPLGLGTIPLRPSTKNNPLVRLFYLVGPTNKGKNICSDGRILRYVHNSLDGRQVHQVDMLQGSRSTRSTAASGASSCCIHDVLASGQRFVSDTVAAAASSGNMVTADASGHVTMRTAATTHSNTAEAHGAWTSQSQTLWSI